MKWLRNFWDLVAGDHGDVGEPDMARIWEMLDYLRDEAYIPPPDATAA